MQALGELWRRLKFFFRRGEFQRELDEEIQHHLEMSAHPHAGAGESPEEARFVAQRELVKGLLLREESRDMRGWTSFERFAQDLRYGLRRVRRSPSLRCGRRVHTRAGHWPGGDLQRRGQCLAASVSL